MENSVCAVIVTYNRLKLLKICLDSVLNQNVEISHIVIINNKSTDGTSDYLNGLDNEKLIIKKYGKKLRWRQRI
ncbi:glycosyl transferase [Companilactobacillus farciminis]|nr:glycosyl transferase [Companilactobacillus farciminis]